MQNIGERLLGIRGGTSREKYAPLLGVSRNTLVNYEKGITPPPHDFLIKILDLHSDINPSWLLTGKGPMKGFTASESPAPIAPESLGAKGELVVSEDTLELIKEILEEKLGERRSEINADRMMKLITTLHRFYSRNFIDSAKFRRDTMEQNIESLVKLALPE